MVEYQVIVDEEDNVIGYKERGALTKEDNYRVTALWLQNSKGELLLAKRSLNKSSNPGMWGPSVAGTVEKDETYDDNILKEAAEEIGLTGHKFTFLKKIKGKGRTGTGNIFVCIYFLRLDKTVEDFVLKKDEVAEVRWWSFDELAKEIKLHPEHFTPSTPKHITFLKEELPKLK
jgi:isopentenyl-diphosphate Delta-isomerase